MNTTLNNPTMKLGNSWVSLLGQEHLISGVRPCRLFLSCRKAHESLCWRGDPWTAMPKVRRQRLKRITLTPGKTMWQCLNSTGVYFSEYWGCQLPQRNADYPNWSSLLFNKFLKLSLNNLINNYTLTPLRGPQKNRISSLLSRWLWSDEGELACIAITKLYRHDSWALTQHCSVGSGHLSGLLSQLPYTPGAHTCKTW